MLLTLAQKQALKAAIVADVTLAPLFALNTPDNDFAIAAALNQIAPPDLFVYRTAIPVQDIYDQVQWAKLTPTDAPDGTQLWLNRAIHCQGKQLNVQILLQGQPTINGSKVNVRAGLQDALTNVPSGVSGALVSGGWVGVRDNALARKATRAEKIFADTSGGNGSTAALAATMVVEGALTYQNISDARTS